jgi:hypothetical protein
MKSTKHGSSDKTTQASRAEDRGKRLTLVSTARCDPEPSAPSIGTSILLQALLRASHAAPSTIAGEEAASNAGRNLLTSEFGVVRLMPLTQLVAELQSAEDFNRFDQKIQEFEQVRLLLSDDCGQSMPEWRGENLLRRFFEKRSDQARVAILSNRPICDLAKLFPTRVLNTEPFEGTGWNCVELLGPLSSSLSEESSSLRDADTLSTPR